METLEPLSFTLSLRGSYIFIIYCLSLQAYSKVSMQRLIFWVIPQSKTNFFWYFWCGGQLWVTISPPKTSHVIQPLNTLYSCSFEYTVKFYLIWQIVWFEVIELSYILDSFIAKDRKKLIYYKSFRQFQRDPGPV